LRRPSKSPALILAMDYERKSPQQNFGFTFGVYHFQVVHSHLEDLCLLQLSRALLLKRSWDEAAEFREGVVDPISPSLLDDPAPLLPRDALVATTLRRSEATKQKHPEN